MNGVGKDNLGTGEIHNDILPLFDYYKLLIEIRGKMDISIWNSMSAFLIIQSILFIPWVQAIIYGGWVVLVCIVISGMGLSISSIFYLLGYRKRMALRLVEHQLRHVEMEIFHDRLNDTTDVDRYFPMRLWGERAVFLKRAGIYSNLEYQDFEDEIMEHHNEETPEMPHKGPGYSGVKIVTIGIPIMFGIVWGILMCVSIGILLSS